MGGGTEKVPPNDYGTNLGREEEKDSSSRRENTSEEVRGEVCLDRADLVIDEMTGRNVALAGQTSAAPTVLRWRRMAALFHVSRW